MSERDSEKLRGVADWVRSISIPDIDELVNRFLTWPVPASVHPDGTPGQPGRTGTNLMTAAEAKEMLLYVLSSAPQASQPPQGADYREMWLEQISLNQRLCAALAAPPQGASSLLPGWRLVPVEPTDAMLAAAYDAPERAMARSQDDDNAAIYRAMLAASPLPAPQEPARHDILEKLTYHQHERDDLTLDECWEVLASGYRKVHGRTDRQMVMQILALLAAAPAPDSTRGTP